MENKEVISAGKMSGQLMGNWLLWGMLFGFIYSLVYYFIANFVESLVLNAIIAIVLQGITAFITWKESTFSSFRKKTISSNDVSSVMKRLVVFTIVICLLTGIYNMYNVNKAIDKAINKANYQLVISESIASYLYSDKEMEEYNKQKEQGIAKARNQIYIYLIILEIGITAAYFIVLPLEKKEILKQIS